MLPFLFACYPKLRSLLSDFYNKSILYIYPSVIFDSPISIPRLDFFSTTLEEFSPNCSTLLLEVFLIGINRSVTCFQFYFSFREDPLIIFVKCNTSQERLNSSTSGSCLSFQLDSLGPVVEGVSWQTSFRSKLLNRVPSSIYIKLKLTTRNFYSIKSVISQKMPKNNQILKTPG